MVMTGETRLFPVCRSWLLVLLYLISYWSFISDFLLVLLYLVSYWSISVIETLIRQGDVLQAYDTIQNVTLSRTLSLL
jgi:hypothetical protein